jgi:hypothetical protein
MYFPLGKYMTGLRASSPARPAAAQADRDRWLRERRAAVYVEALNFTLGANERRRGLLKAQEDITDEIRSHFQEARGIYFLPETQDLIARTLAYSSGETTTAFLHMRETDRAAWATAIENINGRILTIDGALKNKKDEAADAASHLIKVIRRDLQNLLLLFVAICKEAQPLTESLNTV